MVLLHLAHMYDPGRDQCFSNFGRQSNASLAVLLEVMRSLPEFESSLTYAVARASGF